MFLHVWKAINPMVLLKLICSGSTFCCFLRNIFFTKFWSGKFLVHKVTPPLCCLGYYIVNIYTYGSNYQIEHSFWIENLMKITQFVLLKVVAFAVLSPVACKFVYWALVVPNFSDRTSDWYRNTGNTYCKAIKIGWQKK